jgi:aromatic ring hydroxylase
MRSGAEYRDALRDGRQVWVIGEGRIADVTTHPTTRSMVDEYAAWYDLHRDPTWADVLLTPDGFPWGTVVPTRADDLAAMGRCFSATLFPSAGNVTHTPTYGYLIALGVLHAMNLGGSAEHAASAGRYRDFLARSGRFLTFAAGSATIGYRMRSDPAERAALRVVKETDAGLVLSGKIAMLTSPAYAEDVYIGTLNGVTYEGKAASFVINVDAPGVSVICRKISAHHRDPFIAPMSSRYDELDGQLWLSDVFVPWERVFLMDATPDAVAAWLFWHQLYCWLAKAEFTLGLGLACADAMGLAHHDPTVEYIVDLMVEVQTVTACLTAAERDPEYSPFGYCIPSRGHLAAGSIAMQRCRQRMTEILRILPGSSLLVAPADSDLSSPEVADGLEEAFGGGGYTALQRSALLSLAWDHVASALDGRESAFELHANGGIPAWRARLRRDFRRYNELANGVLRALQVDMPEIDVTHLGVVPITPRRVVTPPRA